MSRRSREFEEELDALRDSGETGRVEAVPAAGLADAMPLYGASAARAQADDWPTPVEGEALFAPAPRAVSDPVGALHGIYGTDPWWDGDAELDDDARWAEHL